MIAFEMENLFAEDAFHVGQTLVTHQPESARKSFSRNDIGWWFIAALIALNSSFGMV